MSTTLSCPVGEQDFLETLRHFASGVTVISTLDADGAAHGMTATAFSSLSLEPPLVLVAVAHGTRCHTLVTNGRRFGISMLHAHQADLSRHFGGKPIPGAAPSFSLLDGVPVLGDAMAILACDLDRAFEGGDHTIFVGLVTNVRSTEGEPLVHFGGRYRILSKDII